MCLLYQLFVSRLCVYYINSLFANPYVRLKSGDTNVGNISIRSDLRQGGVLFPYFFNAYLYSVLPRINLSCFLGLTNLSYIAYADDLLLISRTISSVIK